VPERLPFVVLPGLGLDTEAWAPTLHRLGDGPGTFVRRLPGYGQPAPRGVDLHPRALAADVMATLPSDVGPVVVLGHSASCQIAAHLAAIEPSRVASLVLVGPTTDPRAATWPRLARRWVATALHETPRQVPALVRQYRRTTVGAMLRSMESARRDAIEEALAPVRVPILVVRGRHDRICPEDFGAAVARCGARGGDLVTLGAGAHMVPLTHGHLLASAITDFLSDKMP
jgi:pimeloyl-ACP methyl ester carboxylesterase